MASEDIKFWLEYRYSTCIPVIELQVPADSAENTFPEKLQRWNRNIFNCLHIYQAKTHFWDDPAASTFP